MHGLLINNCIRNILYDPDSSQQTGEIHFLNGETFDGEITNNQPNGSGTLTLPDDSTYKGNFDQNGILSGTYTHPTGNYFTGSFLRDRFKKGTIFFCDGDFFEGEWGLEKSRWGLKTGILKNEEGVVIGKLEKKGDVESLRSKSKEIYKNYGQYGFCVVFDKLDSDCKSEKGGKLLFTAEGTSYEEEKKDGSLLKQIIRKTNIQLPFSKIDTFTNNSISKSVLKLCYGIRIESDKGNKSGILTFDSLEKVSAKGEFEFSRLRFRFKGDLFISDTAIDTLSLKKTTFGKLTIKLKEKEFGCLKSFFSYIDELNTTKLRKPSLIKPERPVSHKNSLKAQETMKDIIGDIKKDNECVIM